MAQQKAVQVLFVRARRQWKGQHQHLQAGLRQGKPVTDRPELLRCELLIPGRIAWASRPAVVGQDCDPDAALNQLRGPLVAEIVQPGVADGRVGQRTSAVGGGRSQGLELALGDQDDLARGGRLPAERGGCPAPGVAAWQRGVARARGPLFHDKPGRIRCQ